MSEVKYPCTHEEGRRMAIDNWTYSCPSQVKEWLAVQPSSTEEEKLAIIVGLRDLFPEELLVMSTVVHVSQRDCQAHFAPGMQCILSAEHPGQQHEYRLRWSDKCDSNA